MTVWPDPADLAGFSEGTLDNAQRFLGAHFTEAGTCRFAVWAPGARAVAVAGDFNDWSRTAHPMEFHSGPGIWTAEVPDVRQGDKYKYVVTGPDGRQRFKADPFAVYAEVRPGTASRAWDLSGYAWQDGAWMRRRRTRDPFSAPMAIYEVHAGSFQRREDGGLLSYTELCDALVSYVADMGFTHIELLPLCEHPYDGSWGYQATGYFAITSRYGTPQEFMALVDACHQKGIGVIMDWVPGHFTRDEHGLAWFDGTALFEHPDPRRGQQPEWGTNVFDLEKPQVQSFLLSSAVFLMDAYHLDGLRVDAVSSMLYLDYGRGGDWLPNESGGRENTRAAAFLRRLNQTVLARCPGALMFAEESTAYPGVTRKSGLAESLGFDFKWNMGWMNDVLDYMATDPLYRSGKHNRLTFSMTYAFSEDYLLPLSHDEVVHGKKSLLDKMPGEYEQKFANLRLLLGYMYAHPGKKLLFMGAELGQFIEWDEKRPLDWFLLEYGQHRGTQCYVRALNAFYAGSAPLYESDGGWEGFEWCSVDDRLSSALVFMRYARGRKKALLCAFNFTPIARPAYRTGVPLRGTYTPAFCSDAGEYGGSGCFSAMPARTADIPEGGFGQSLELELPPLSATFYTVRKLSDRTNRRGKA
jgi:1,4-alpha-glucan branching enzyme